MPKISYIAIDPKGREHTRTTDSRTYTHTVVALPSKTVNMQRATKPEWHKTDGNNYRYFLSIAAGNDPHPEKSYRSLARGDTEEEVAADLERVRLVNEARRANARAATVGIDEAQYCARQEHARIAAVEKLDQEGYFDKFVNLGWCGRLGLAEKLAASAVAYVSATILEAREVTK